MQHSVYSSDLIDIKQLLITSSLPQHFTIQ